MTTTTKTSATLKNSAFREKDTPRGQKGYLVPFFANMDLEKSDISKPFWHSTIACGMLTGYNNIKVFILFSVNDPQLLLLPGLALVM